jgi:4'-phosphopantetheinyl transferase EntD
MVAPIGSCAAIGVDVEEVDAHRAHALVRMSLSDAEIALIRATDAELLQGPIALWCARESCVKAHALEVGWFGTALVATHFEPCESPIETATRAWKIEIAFENSPIFAATAWATDEAVYACAARV